MKEGEFYRESGAVIAAFKEGASSTISRSNQVPVISLGSETTKGSCLRRVREGQTPAAKPLDAFELVTAM